VRALSFVLCALACACASAPPAVAPEAAATEARVIPLGQSYTIQSEVLGGPREINIWVPADYPKDDERLTVLYVLDGGVEQDFPHIAGLGQLGALSWTYQRLIIVGVKTENRQAELTRRPHDERHAAEFPQAGGARRFQEFLATEVIPFVEARYRTGQRRALMGESLAGLFVVDTFLHRPDLFGDYIAISPSLWWDDQHFARDGGHDLEGRAPSDTRLYLTIANEGGAMQAGMDRFLRLLEAAPEGSVTWRYVDRSASETHATIYHAAALDALRWLYPLPPYEAEGPTPWYFEDTGERTGSPHH
jgi:predicted alpha/beta superfamily hydrolase